MSDYQFGIHDQSASNPYKSTIGHQWGLIQDTVQPACKVNKLNSSYPSKSYFFGGQEMHLHLSPMFVALSVTCELDMRSTKFK